MEPNLEEGLEIVEDCISKTDRDIEERQTQTGDDGTELSAILFTHGDYTLAAYSHPDSHYFILQLEYDVLEDVAAVLAAEEKYGKEDIPVGQEIEVEVGDKTLERTSERVAAIIEQLQDSGKYSKVRSKLVQMLSQPECAYTFREELNGVHGFILRTKLFVYEPEFRASTFDTKCQNLVSHAMYPREFLRKIFNTQLQQGSNIPTEGSTDALASRGFR